ncbi:hypothetical protein Tco_1338148 [Tanacetum coccineum]
MHPTQASLTANDIPGVCAALPARGCFVHYRLQFMRWRGVPLLRPAEVKDRLWVCQNGGSSRDKHLLDQGRGPNYIGYRACWFDERDNRIVAPLEDVRIETVWMVEEEAYASREAWARSIGLSQATTLVVLVA